MTTPLLCAQPRAALLLPLFALSLAAACPTDPQTTVDAGFDPVDVGDAPARVDAGPQPADAATDTAIDGGPDAGEVGDAGARPDASDVADGGGIAPPFPSWPPVFISAFGLSYDGPVADGADVWVELTVANAAGLAQLGGWSFSSADFTYVNRQLAGSQVPFALADGDVLRVHGSGYTGTPDAKRSDNNPAVWDVVSTEPFGPSLKHGLLWLEAADGRVLDAVMYETGRNQGDWFGGAALTAAQKVATQAQWPSHAADDALVIADADREWARIDPVHHRAGNSAADWQAMGATLDTYYEPAVGKTGAALESALHDIVVGHVVIPYSEVASAFFETDVDPADASQVIDFYTGRPTRSDFNKEHVWAKSHGGFISDAYAGYSDLHHLRPTRPDINSKRWHLDFAEGGQPYSDSGCKVVEGYSFEPRDAVKGDVARTLFYMAVRYEGRDPPMPDLELVETIPSLLNAQGVPDNNQHVNTPRIGKLSELLQWHVDDPPDARERARNDVVFKRFQHNRNPFVDHPEWVHEIWGGPAWPHGSP